jgi:DNA replication protein DnaC
VTTRKLTPADYKLMRLPRALWGARLQDVDGVNKKYVRNLLEDVPTLRARGANILIMGTSGVGKTCLAAMFAKTFRANKLTVFFATPSDIRDAVKAREGFDGDMSMIERAKRVDCFVLDDYRADKGDGWWSNTDLVSVIRYRQSHMKTTIVTSSLPHAVLMKDPLVLAIYERMVDIVFGSGSVDKVEANRESFKDSLLGKA